jgi:hypothetical protein
MTAASMPRGLRLSKYSTQLRDAGRQSAAGGASLLASHHRHACIHGWRTFGATDVGVVQRQFIGFGLYEGLIKAGLQDGADGSRETRMYHPPDWK